MQLAPTRSSWLGASSDCARTAFYSAAPSASRATRRPKSSSSCILPLLVESLRPSAPPGRSCDRLSCGAFLRRHLCGRRSIGAGKRYPSLAGATRARTKRGSCGAVWGVYTRPVTHPTTAARQALPHARGRRGKRCAAPRLFRNNRQSRSRQDATRSAGPCRSRSGSARPPHTQM
jgi:hypothetical protein